MESLFATKKPVQCPEYSEAFLKLLPSMAEKAHEYITPEASVTNNSVEGFHGLALKYRGK